MASLNDNFKELVRRIKQGRELTHASYEPIYYLIFPPADILNVKRELPAWTANLRNNNWDVHVFSVAGHILDLLQNAKLRQLWLTADRKTPTGWEKTNQALANYLSNGALQTRLEEQLAALEGNPRALLLVTDLEALHPYLRIGAIESQLQGKFTVTTVFLYPGERTGKTRLKFLGFYPEDGNYRSVHVGG